MAENNQTSDVSALTVQLLSAYLANNTVPAEALAELIRTTKAALTQEASSLAETPEAELFTPAVTVRKSLASPEHIISLIDGKPYKTLKRHLATRGLTPDEYRARYNLPASYPMVAPAYAEQRRAVAHRLGLGRKGPRPEAAEKQDKVSPVEPGDERLAPESAGAVTFPAKQPRKASVKRAPQRRREATAVQSDSPAKSTASSKQDTGTIDGDMQPSGERSDKVSGAGAPRRPRASAKKPASTKAKTAKKTAVVALDASEPSISPDTAEAAQVAPETKPSKRRGKIGLFKNTSSDSLSSGGADTLPASAQAQDGRASSDQRSSLTASKARGSKRMAREPKPGTA